MYAQRFVAVVSALLGQQREAAAAFGFNGGGHRRRRGFWSLVVVVKDGEIGVLFAHAGQHFRWMRHIFSHFLRRTALEAGQLESVPHCRHREAVVVVANDVERVFAERVTRWWW